MPKEDHVFKKHFVKDGQLSAEETQKMKQDSLQSKLDDFAWEEDDDPGSDVPLLPEFTELNNCAEVIMAHILDTLGGVHFEGLDDHGVRFVVPIDVSLHSLLIERFSDQWTLDSRLLVFKGIQEQLTEKVNKTDNRVALDARISKALPPSRKKFSSDEVILYDDALAVDDESDSITAEIPVHFEVNS